MHTLQCKVQEVIETKWYRDGSKVRDFEMLRANLETMGRSYKSKDEQSKIDEQIKVIKQIDQIKEQVDELYGLYDLDSGCESHHT